MRSEPVLKQAQFNPKVKVYWLLSALLICTVTMFGIVLVPVVAILVWFFAGKMLAAMSATLSKKKLVVKKGVLVRVEKSIPLDKITDVALEQGPIMRMLGIHKLSFETAGQSGQGALVSLLGVQDPHEFREAILAQKERLFDNQESTVTSNTPDEQALLLRLTEAVERIEKRLQGGA